MRKRLVKPFKYILLGTLTLAILAPFAEDAIVVLATSISGLQQQINEHQNQLDDINDQISTLTDEQDLVQEMIDDLNAEIINTMASISLKEEEMTAKIGEIAEKEIELANKQIAIDETQAAYEVAKATEEKQFADMQRRVRAIYENGTYTYLDLFLSGGGLADMLNRMDYVERVYEYDRMKLEEYETTKIEVHNLWEQLKLEKAQLETEKTNLETEKTGLETAKAALETQKTELDTMLAKKKQESANYDAEIKRYQQEASVAKKLLQQEKKQLQLLQQQQNQGNTAAATGTYTPTNYTATIDNATGSDLGKRVAKYACQYIGNPYVYGGTSLTNGADCSGFVYRVYKDFGYNLPRTSFEQRSTGTGVTYSEAQPGDLICYEGHVALYIGDGMIVHASSSKTGIKVSKAQYRTILAVRRIV